MAISTTEIIQDSITSGLIQIQQHVLACEHICTATHSSKASMQKSQHQQPASAEAEVGTQYVPYVQLYTKQVGIQDSDGAHRLGG